MVERISEVEMPLLGEREAVERFEETYDYILVFTNPFNETSGKEKMISHAELKD
jgi:hypothetical protein